MGYTTFKGGNEAVEAAEALLQGDARLGDMVAALPLLVDQVAAEAGVYDARLAAAAIRQARGDLARAASLLRAWGAVLPRATHNRIRRRDMRMIRRLTPAFRDPPAGQYLGASQDFARRLLDVDMGERDAVNGPAAIERETEGPGSAPPPAPPALAGLIPRALEALEREGLVNPGAPADAFDRTREADDADQPRGSYLHFLCGADTGALTAMAYGAAKDFGSRREPTLTELVVAMVPVTVPHPRSGEPVAVGEVPVTYAEYVVYVDENGEKDARLVLGVGATLGRVERRAMSAALLDATASREAEVTGEPLQTPAADAEYLKVLLDGQEASGFVEHYKLPHHVPFESKLDRLRWTTASAVPHTT